MRVTWLLLLALLLPLPGTAPALAQFPAGYDKYGRDCAKVQRQVWGKRWSPILLAQIEQESSWNPAARSPWASGLAQFIPATQGAVEREYGLIGDIYDPMHACLLQAFHMRDLARSTGSKFDGFYGQWAAALRSYNGSPASFWCEHRKAGEPRDVWLMDPFSCRKAAFHHENTEYPRRILFQRFPRYYWEWN